MFNCKAKEIRWHEKFQQWEIFVRYSVFLLSSIFYFHFHISQVDFKISFIHIIFFNLFVCKRTWRKWVIKNQIEKFFREIITITDFNSFRFSLDNDKFKLHTNIWMNGNEWIVKATENGCNCLRCSIHYCRYRSVSFRLYFLTTFLFSLFFLLLVDKFSIQEVQK